MERSWQSPCSLFRREGLGGRRAVFALLWSIVYVACAVDERRLNLVDSASRGGASAAAGRGGASASHGGNDSVGDGGMGGDGTDVGPSVDCSDLNQNTVPDCSETLVENPAFDYDTTSWTPGANAAIKWDSLDARGSAASGTLRVENRSTGSAQDGGLVYTGATQCVPIDANHAYDLFAQMYSRGPTITGYASVVGRVFPSADCSGSPLRIETSPIQGTIDLWITLQTTVPATAGAGSILIELSVGRLSANPGPVSVVFDNVLLR